MKRLILLTTLLSLFVSIACNRPKNYIEKEIVFNDKLTPEQKIKLAAYLVPTKKQYEWQKLELTAFIHFGINTFTGREWGDGTEDPDLFNPTDLNAEQWVVALKEGGFKMIILTAKHHDGFCLWPTKTTEHSVASSSWRDGGGDVVRELKSACDKHDMKFGVYLSPWDRNAPSYGDSPEYNKMFVQQLSELLSNYGEIHEVWFDGANAEGPNGKKQIYDWKAFYHVIDSLQPKAVKAIMGDDVRWVGNEQGLGRETEWSVTPLRADIHENALEENQRLEISATAKDLGSRKLIEKAHSIYWYPSEVDVSIRSGWFYHPEQDAQVKSLEELVNIYYQSVGMNSVLLLNVPPDRRGLIHEIDAARLKEFGEYVRKTFEDNKMNESHSYWKAKNGDFREYSIKQGETINTILLQEDIEKGQRVEVFKVEGLIDGSWNKLTEGTTIGYKRILRFEDVVPEKIRITIIETRVSANIKEIGAYYAGEYTTDTLDINLNYIDKDWVKVMETNPLTVDIQGKEIEISGFSYMPNQETESVYKYKFMLSSDGKKWSEPSSQREFGNIKNNPMRQYIHFDAPYKARYFKLEIMEGTEGGKPTINPSQIAIIIP
ncbi:MAG: alpha-L-fucosidase [Dysgonamonadaceae bacterium]|nr:alpha-L-fucosidase [Dysgonamonadaceae bacterium]MDD4245627.1 alpha-L-fucosidase [Dysgonamonadaceae bacterium]